MKLYNVNLSNFATKSRLVIYEKGLNIEMVPIPEAVSNPPNTRRSTRSAKLRRSMPTGC